MSPQVSVIIPYYNSEEYIVSTLDSIKSQEMVDFQCVLVDDGSSDNTFSLVSATIEHDPRFINVSRPSSCKAGGRGAKNYGFSLAQGLYIVFFDSDDVMKPDFLSKRIAYLQQHEDRHAVISDYYWKVVRNSHQPKRIFRYKPEIFKDFKKAAQTLDFWIHYMDYRFFYPPGNCMYRKDFLEGKELWNEDTGIGEDHEFHARLYLQGLHLGHIPATTFDYMANQNSMIATSNAIGPLISRSYGKMCVLHSLNQYLGNHPTLVSKETVCQIRILRKIAGTNESSYNKKKATKIILSRLKICFSLLGYSNTRKSVLIFIILWLNKIYALTRLGYSLYSLVFPDRNPTKDGTYFIIE